MKTDNNKSTEGVGNEYASSLVARSFARESAKVERIKQLNQISFGNVGIGSLAVVCEQRDWQIQDVIKAAIHILNHKDDYNCMTEVFEHRKERGE